MVPVVAARVYGCTSASLHPCDPFSPSPQLCHAFSTSHFEHPELRAVQVSTVDAFQGAEKEVIILSCVRTHRLGFIDSERRMNVALTRGRRHLLIVGNLACLRKNQLWGRVIQHCEGKRGREKEM